MTSDAPKLQRKSIDTLVRGLDVLTHVSATGGKRVEDVAEALGLPISTTYRYINTLADRGFIAEQGSRYSAGPALVQTARVASRTHRLIDAATPLLRWLVQQTGETALLTVRVQHLALCLDRLESPQPIRLSYEVGSFRPLYAGASGKILLAFSPDAVLDEILDAGIPPESAEAPTAAELRGDIQQIRSDGYTITQGEVDAQATGIAVPVFVGKELTCALSVAGPSFRLAPSTTPAILETLRKAGRYLGEYLSAG